MLFKVRQAFRFVILELPHESKVYLFYSLIKRKYCFNANCEFTCPGRASVSASDFTKTFADVVAQEKGGREGSGATLGHVHFIRFRSEAVLHRSRMTALLQVAATPLVASPQRAGHPRQARPA